MRFFKEYVYAITTKRQIYTSIYIYLLFVVIFGGDKSDRAVDFST